MTVPDFEEYVPATDCPCPGCADQRRTAAGGLPRRYGGNPAARGARRAMVLVTAAGVVLGGAAGESAGAPHDPAPVPGAGLPAGIGPLPDSPQGVPGPLRGAGASGPQAAQAAPVPRATTRADIIDRAKKWVTAQVPYSMSKYWSDGYRQDCSGYVSMAWNLAGNEWTGSLAAYGTRIARADLEPGDILLFHNLANPANGSHVTIFGGWTDSTHTRYTAYEQTKPHTRKQTTPMAYWTNSASYVAYRYKGLNPGKSGGETTATPFPGAAKFGPRTNNVHVTRLGTMLVARGGKRFYKVGPDPVWTDADRRATQAFQRAQGWKGAEADGIPGPDTWELLVTGTGHDIPAAGGQSGSKAVPAFPGRGYFRPGRSNSHVDKLGKQLVKKGYGAYYRSGPDPRWTEADRRNVEAFQKAQGWRGAEADGYPGPETWRRLFA
ncbi:peptidoglycan-binding protein [Streptomyces sp. NBC_01789]|uniref:peptidoglycan-binding protein n=1 Tax=Streptomyces sp. NBC_01789 TaxID=2975941 RepID=UPI002252EA1E|nr:peptidoglycan-binding protein [Streptomyces sp. NBC_01789]MCX4448991.1 peptidoglycan-binding protein [Streptomyces sp. NBC_01789]